MKTIHTLASTTLAAAMAAGAAFAQQPTTTPPTGRPETQPNPALTQPTRPLTQPARPVDPPTRPVVQPTRPVDRPTRPLDQPARPLLQPAQPQVQPSRAPEQRGQPPGMAVRDYGNDRMPDYAELNARGDGSVTRNDLSAHSQLLERFDDIDTAPDGTITRAEYEAWKAKTRSRDMARPQDQD
ncbi:hypothetical protein [Luteimonas kalidii]|uniref:EF-hand domain-containing protein n=1 Tax=Luteimonas kalidii TaxID=3042025 RepID=A0ABT6JQ56_9GAMM|nr:hypothetical protein [Luteimonas kalidii]MDH5832805.1 hypothetical protein [Luteimonas kalidii]